MLSPMWITLWITLKQCEKPWTACVVVSSQTQRIVRVCANVDNLGENLWKGCGTIVDSLWGKIQQSDR